MLKSENFRTPLTRAQISEFLSGLDGVAVVHEPLPTTVEVRQKFMRLKEFALPVDHQPQSAFDAHQNMFLFLERQQFYAYEEECQRIGRELTDREMYENGRTTLKSFRYYHGWALTEGVWIPHTWVCRVDPKTIEPLVLIEVGEDVAERYVGTGMHLFDSAKIGDTHGHRTPDEARRSLLAMREEAEEEEEDSEDEEDSEGDGPYGHWSDEDDDGGPYALSDRDLDEWASEAENQWVEYTQGGY
jgi:hypothetical protein